MSLFRRPEFRLGRSGTFLLCALMASGAVTTLNGTLLVVADSPALSGVVTMSPPAAVVGSRAMAVATLTGPDIAGITVTFHAAEQIPGSCTPSGQCTGAWPSAALFSGTFATTCVTTESGTCQVPVTSDTAGSFEITATADTVILDSATIDFTEPPPPTESPTEADASTSTDPVSTGFAAATGGMATGVRWRTLGSLTILLAGAGVAMTRLGVVRPRRRG
jgi:hypothetical protein